ncbi:MAG: hypothetical protein JXR03_21140 [Cyclobacteriaceae bacterium]
MNKERKTLKRRPLGSGVFALVAGILFVGSGIVIYFTGFDVSKIEPSTVLNTYLFAGGLIMIGWGFNRIRYNDGRWIVGQSTINFVLGFLAAAIAILSILINK